MNKWLRRLKNADYYFKNLKANIKYIFQYNMYTLEKERTIALTDKIIDDIIYEFEEDKVLCKNLNILNQQQTIDKLIESPKSFVRFGDGEIYIMQGNNQPFQKYDPILAKRLKEILAGNRDDMYIGINGSYFRSPVICSANNRKFYRLNSYGFRQFFLEHCNHENTFLDASCFGAYYRFDDSFDYETHYSNMENLFKDKKILLVCGKGILDKLKFDVFHLASEKKIVYGKAIDAFDEYDQLLERVLTQATKDTLICVILGMTAKVLVSDLSEKGYLAWDIGHMAKDYDAYMNKYEKSQENINNFWAPD